MTNHRSGAIVQNVVQSVNTPPAPAVVQSLGNGGRGNDGIFDTVDEAVGAAKTAQQDLEALSLETRREIIAKIRETALAHAKGISQQTRDETGMGRVPHKIQKFEVVARGDTRCRGPSANGLVGAITGSPLSRWLRSA